jgi:hypothetical protein
MTRMLMGITARNMATLALAGRRAFRITLQYLYRHEGSSQHPNLLKSIQLRS